MTSTYEFFSPRTHETHVTKLKEFTGRAYPIDSGSGGGGRISGGAATGTGNHRIYRINFRVIIREPKLLHQQHNIKYSTNQELSGFWWWALMENHWPNSER